MTKRLAAVIPFSCLLLAPQLVRGVNWLLDNWFVDLVNTPPPIRLKVLVPVALAWALLSGLVLPSSLIASSVSEFSDIGSYGNPAVFLWYSFFQSLGVFVFWPLCIFFLFKERVQTLLTVLFFMGLVCSVVNAFLFVVNYGPMDITLTFGNGLRKAEGFYIVLNLCILFLVSISIILLRKHNGQKWIFSFSTVGILAFLISGLLNIRAITVDYNKYLELKHKNMATRDGLEPVFNLTKTGKNVVVLMLDKASSGYFESIVQSHQELHDIFTGFTFYKNTVSFATQTLLAAPALYGGYEYTPASMNARQNTSLKDKHNESLLLIPRVMTEEAGFVATVSDLSWANYSVVPDLSFVEEYKNITGLSLKGRYLNLIQKELGISSVSAKLAVRLVEKLLWVSLFRGAPMCLRPVIYYNGTFFDLNDSVSTLFLDWFSVLYALPHITSFTTDKDSLIILTNESTHEMVSDDISISLGYNDLDYSGYRYYKENILVLKQVAEWLVLLKQNGVYDNTRIIIVSDHGIGSGSNDQDVFEAYDLNYGHTKDSLRSFLLFKDFNSKGALSVDMSFMTSADVPSLVFNGIIEKPVNPFTGRLINVGDKEKTEGVFMTLTPNIFMPEHSKSEYIFTVPDDSWYHVKDNIFIDSNWTQEVPR